MSEVIRVPIVLYGSQKWGSLDSLGISFEIVGESVAKKEENYSFIGGHRLRLYKFKKDVHFRVPSGRELDITDVQPAGVPPTRRQVGGRR